MKKFLFLMLVIPALVVLTGCGGSKAPNPRTVVSEELKDAPEWVLKGHDGNGSTLSAIGSVTGTNNVALARSGALGRARTELARQLQIIVKTSLEDHQETAGAFGGEAHDEQYIADTSVQLSEVTVVGSRQEDTWISKTGTYYVLLSLDVDSFKDAVDRMGTLSEAVRKAITERAESAFARLESR